jgi:hypothetical protein
MLLVCIFVPACALPACLHPARALEFESSYSLQKQNTKTRLVKNK